MIQIEVMFGLINIKAVLMYNIDKVILINEVIVMDVTMTKYYAFTNGEKTEPKPKRIYKGFRL